MFITPCFIRKNTFAIRVELSKLGYENSTNNVVGDSIATTPVTSHYTTISQKMYDDPNPNSTWSNNRIDCGRNEEMFLALAALRKDTDKNQWFICHVRLPLVQRFIQCYTKCVYIRIYQGFS